MTATGSNPPGAQVRVQALDRDDGGSLAADEIDANGNVERIAPAGPVPQDAAEGIGGVLLPEGDVVIAGLYGSLRVSRNGHWTYVPDQEEAGDPG